MSLTLTQSLSAVAVNITSSFQAQGGTGPYVYSVRPDGAGGTISGSGLYTAPSQVSQNAIQSNDTVQVRDSLGAIATAKILVATPIGLLCDIIQKYMGMDSNHIYFWDQKVMQPTDSLLYVAVSLMSCKAFGNNIYYDGTGSGLEAFQAVNMKVTVDVDIISRGPAARDQKELVLMSFMSVYSEQQQEANSFYIGRLPDGSRFINLSEIDGAAIPYRYKISVAMQYTVTNRISVPYFDTFAAPTVTVNP